MKVIRGGTNCPSPCSIFMHIHFFPDYPLHTDLQMLMREEVEIEISYCGNVTNVTNVTYDFQHVHFPKLDTQIRQVYSISPEKTLVSQDFYPRKFIKKT